MEQKHMLNLKQEPYYIYTLGIMKNNTLCKFILNMQGYTELA